jgi:DNA-binding response OmpR family regulator
MSFIAFIEDDPSIRSTVQIGLKMKGLRLECFSSAEEFLAVPDRISSYDLIMLDLGLPGLNGFNLCEQIRQKDFFKPIIVITAMTEEDIAVSTFIKGADDFVRKPFGLEELYARIQRLLGRAVAQKKIIRFEGLSLDRSKRMIQYKEEVLELAKKEFMILALLIENAGELISRDHFLNSIDEEVKMNDRTLDSHMSHLRKKLKLIGADNISITSIYGLGYKIEKSS